MGSRGVVGTAERCGRAYGVMGMLGRRREPRALDPAGPVAAAPGEVEGAPGERASLDLEVFGVSRTKRRN